ncbi:unnamed protein product [[Candida] boidinii]|nr:unnamed protein product [[Candida] boidinii]
MINEIKLLKFKSNFLYGYIFIEFIGELKSRNLIYTISINLIIIISQLILFINITNFKVNDKININRIDEIRPVSSQLSQRHPTTRGNHIQNNHNIQREEEEEGEDGEEDYQFVDEYSDNNYNEEELDAVTRLDYDQEINQYSNDIVEENGNIIGSIDFYPSTDIIMKNLRSIWELR